MITPNTDFTFTQVKSDNPRSFNGQTGKVADVTEMILQRTREKSIMPSSMKGEDEVCERTRRLNDLLIDAVDETLKHVFKEAGAEVIYSFLENKCHLMRNDFAHKSEEFSADLERLLGSAAPLIEKMVLKNLYSRLELEFLEKEGYGFSDYVKELREKLDVKG